MDREMNPVVLIIVGVIVGAIIGPILFEATQWVDFELGLLALSMAVFSCVAIEIFCRNRYEEDGASGMIGIGIFFGSLAVTWGMFGWMVLITKPEIELNSLFWLAVFFAEALTIGVFGFGISEWITGHSPLPSASEMHWEAEFRRMKKLEEESGASLID